MKHLLPSTLKTASVSENSSIGDWNGRRFFLRNRENENALAATVRVTRAPATFVAETKSDRNVISSAKGEKRAVKMVSPCVSLLR